MPNQIEKTRRGGGRVAFLARMAEFRSLLDAGNPQRWVYDNHAAALGISYSQFNRYVGIYLRPKAKNEHQKETRPDASGPTAPTAQTTANNGPGSLAGQSGSKPAKPVPFHHNAQGGKRSDLI